MMKRWLIIAALACALSSTGAVAALNLQRTTTISDSFGGTLNAATSGTIEIPGADTSTQVTLTNFHPHDTQNLVANGSLTRTHERSNETVTNTYNGSATLAGTDKQGKPLNDTVSLQNLQAVRDGDGPAFSGTIVLNGKSIDAAHMPEEVKRLLQRVLRVFDFE
jgi:hypothetical protein